MDKQRDFVLRTIEERGVKFVRLWFTDVIGTLKSVAIAPAEVEGAFTEGLGFDGSAIEGLTRSYESDLLAHPDPTTFQTLPWRGEIDPTARRPTASPPSPIRVTFSSGRSRKRRMPGSRSTRTRRSSSTC